MPLQLKIEWLGNDHPSMRARMNNLGIVWITSGSTDSYRIVWDNPGIVPQ
jgi:hypothetical protein